MKRAIAIATLVAAMAVPTAAVANDVTVYELGNGANISFQCDGGWNQATVHNIPSGLVLSTVKVQPNYEFTPDGIQFTFGTEGLTFTFTPMGEFEPTTIAPMVDHCWEVPGPSKTLDEVHTPIVYPESEEATPVATLRRIFAV